MTERTINYACHLTMRKSIPKAELKHTIETAQLGIDVILKNNIKIPTEGKIFEICSSPERTVQHYVDKIKELYGFHI